MKTNKDEKNSVLQTSIFTSPNQVNLANDLDMISIISITIAVVIVVLVIVIACVCVKKAQLRMESMRTPLDLSSVTLPRNLTDAEKSVYIGTTHRYIDFDKSKPLMQGNYSFDSYPVPYSTMPVKDGQLGEEMKAYGQQKPWDRPLPPTAVTNKRKSEIQQHVYDCPQ